MTPDMRARARWDLSIHESGHVLAALLLAPPRVLLVAALHANGDAVTGLPSMVGWRDAMVTMAGGLAASYLAHMRPPPGPVPDLPPDVGESAVAQALRLKWRRCCAATPDGKLKSDADQVNKIELCVRRRERCKDTTLAMLWRNQRVVFKLATVLYICGEVSARALKRKDGKRWAEILTTTT